MEGYLGTTIIPQEVTEFKDYGRSDWAMYFLERYGGYDGAHHKDWTLDQIARVMKGTPVIIKVAEWSPNDKYPEGLKEFRISTGEPSQEYLDWVVSMKAGEDGPETYSYEEGIAP